MNVFDNEKTTVKLVRPFGIEMYRDEDDGVLTIKMWRNWFVRRGEFGATGYPSLLRHWQIGPLCIWRQTDYALSLKKKAA